MKIGDEVYVHGYVDEIRNDVVIIRNEGGYFGTVPSEVNCSEKPNNCEACRFDDKYGEESICSDCSRHYSDCYEPKTEPQTEGYMTAEQTEDYRKMLDKAEHRVYGNIEDEPQTDCKNCNNHDRCVYQPKDEPQTRMTEDDAFYIVFKDLTKDEGLFTGRYDAKHGSRQYMHGVSSVMEYIAYRVGEDCLDAFNEHFVKNLIESEEKAGRSE